MFVWLVAAGRLYVHICIYKKYLNLDFCQLQSERGKEHFTKQSC